MVLTPMWVYPGEARCFTLGRIGNHFWKTFSMDHEDYGGKDFFAKDII